MRRLILKAIDQWKQWRLDRAAKRVMPERVKLQERHAKRLKKHRNSKPTFKRMCKENLAKMNVEPRNPKKYARTLAEVRELVDG